MPVHHMKMDNATATNKRTARLDRNADRNSSVAKLGRGKGHPLQTNDPGKQRPKPTDTPFQTATWQRTQHGQDSIHVQPQQDNHCQTPRANQPSICTNSRCRLERDSNCCRPKNSIYQMRIMSRLKKRPILVFPWTPCLANLVTPDLPDPKRRSRHCRRSSHEAKTAL